MPVIKFRTYRSSRRSYTPTVVGVYIKGGANATIDLAVQAIYNSFRHYHTFIAQSGQSARTYNVMHVQ